MNHEQMLETMKGLFTDYHHLSSLLMSLANKYAKDNDQRYVSTQIEAADAWAEAVKWRERYRSAGGTEL